MKGTYLGEFEEIVLLTVAVLADKAYGNAILEEIEKRTERSVNLSAIHASLYRLEKKGFVEARKGDPSAVRGGKRKKYYSPTTYGLRSLSRAKELRDGLWDAIPSFILNRAAV
ncbi:MAG: PadR family transcriptional regulator [Bacteroidota bacterium]